MTYASLRTVVAPLMTEAGTEWGPAAWTDPLARAAAWWPWTPYSAARGITDYADDEWDQNIS